MFYYYSFWVLPWTTWLIKCLCCCCDWEFVLPWRDRRRREYEAATRQLKAVEKFRDATEGETSAAESCPVCLEDFTTTPKALGCGHVFCAPCLGQWTRENSTCPDLPGARRRLGLRHVDNTTELHADAAPRRRGRVPAAADPPHVPVGVRADEERRVVRRRLPVRQPRALRARAAAAAAAAVVVLVVALARLRRVLVFVVVDVRRGPQLGRRGRRGVVRLFPYAIGGRFFPSSTSTLTLIIIFIPKEVRRKNPLSGLLGALVTH